MLGFVSRLLERDKKNFRKIENYCFLLSFLFENCVIFTCFRHKIIHKLDVKDIKDNIRWLEKRIDKIESDIGKMIKNSPIWRCKDDILQSVPGIGAHYIGHLNLQSAGIRFFESEKDRHVSRSCSIKLR